MMRDPKRIKRILKEIERVWIKFPDFRLGQLLVNAVTDDCCIFYLEDEKLVSLLRDFDSRMRELQREENHKRRTDVVWPYKSMKEIEKDIKRKLDDLYGSSKVNKGKKPKRKRRKFVGSGYKFPECLMPGGGKTGYGDSEVSKRKKPSRKGKTTRKKTR